jgi:predicted acetyltransferase
MDIEIRPIVLDELRSYFESLETAFHGTLRDEDLEIERSVAEPERYLAATEDGAIVGNAAAVSFRVTVPGGARVPASGITAVGVLPSHRRRGITTALMERQLRDSIARSEPVSLLHASEGGIYGRFGYGVATMFGEIDVQTDRSRFVRGIGSPGRTRLVSRDEAKDRTRSVYEIAAARPGMVPVDDRWWNSLFAPGHEDKDEPPFFVVHEDETGAPDALAQYRVKHRWSAGLPRNELSTWLVVASTPDGYAGVWRYLLDVDLVATVKSWNRPADEPLLRMLEEPRQLKLRLSDGMYLRIVDVPAALVARRYAGDGRLVMEVEDRFLPEVGGRFALEVDGGAAECTRTTDEPDVACTINELGAVYLSGARWTQLAQASLVKELRAGAVGDADALFAWPVAPWCAFVF